MKYKALFLDLDGTTVVPFSNIPTPRVIAAIAKVRDAIHVCLATGRLIHQIQDVLAILKLSGLCVVANGIQIYNPVTKSILREIALNPRDVQKIYLRLSKYKLDLRAFDGTSDVLYTGQRESKVLSLFYESMPTDIVDAIAIDLSSFSEVVAHKLLAREQGHSGMEICHATATKQHGIFEVSKILGINTHEIIGVGDGYNDYPLLSACGLKIAMGNAVPELKAIADFIAPTVDEDGVAIVIEKFILNS